MLLNLNILDLKNQESIKYLSLSVIFFPFACFVFLTCGSVYVSLSIYVYLCTYMTVFFLLDVPIYVNLQLCELVYVYILMYVLEYVNVLWYLYMWISICTTMILYINICKWRMCVFMYVGR